MADCGACSDPLPVETGEYAKCSVCNSLLHFECADILESTWNRMGQARRDNWKCNSCTVSKGKSSKDPTVSSKSLIGKVHTEYLIKMEETIKSQFSQYEKNFGQQLNEFKTAMEFFSNKLDEYEGQVKSYSAQVKCLQESQDLLTKENEKLKKEVSSYKSQLEDLEQYNRNRNIQIDGIPENTNEKVGDVVQKLSDIIGVQVNLQSDIQAVHRLPTRREVGPKPIVVQFSNRQTRDLFISKAKKMKVKSTDFNSNVPVTNVYINEHLTPFNKNLLYNTKKLREIGWKYVWTREGKIFARKNEGGSAIRITSLDQVNGLLNMNGKVPVS